MCPDHDVHLVESDTKYGKRYDCPFDLCDVMCWGGGTSTPADQETRTARKRAHTAFDSLWKKGEMQVFDRRGAYKLLAWHMEVRPKEAHIGMFNADQCDQVVKFVDTVRKGADG